MNNRQDQPVDNPQPVVLSKADPVVRRIVRAWRTLTSGKVGRRVGGGQPTLVACSGGADSTALILALAVGGGGRGLVVGHVVHNLRPRAEAFADRDAVVGLAGRLGLACEVSEVSVPGTGNAERHARELRYGALVAIAKARGLRFIATAHHADDQLETLLMALARGAGVRGLGGMAAMRRLDTGVALVRPMLHPIASVTRVEAEGLCARAGVPWQVDATNTDTSRLRAAIRMEVVPRLAAIRPGVRTRAVMTCQQLQGAERVIHAQAKRVVDAAGQSEGALVWSRAMLRSVEPIVLGAVLRLGYRKLLGAGGMDAISASVLEACTSAIRDGSTEPRELAIGQAVVRVRVRAVALRTKS